MDTMTYGQIACWVLLAAAIGIACVGLFSSPHDEGPATDAIMVLVGIVVIAFLVIAVEANVTITRINNVNQQGQTK
jgi:hypothetical protein